MKTILSLVATAFFLFWMHTAQAQLQFDLNPASQTGTPGTTVTFNATLTNVGTDTIFLNGTDFNGLEPGFTLDSTPFFNNFPLFLIGGDAATADLFTVAIDPSVVPGDYFGSFAIVGGVDANAQDTLATQNFELTVPSAVTPEGGSGFLLLFGLGAVATYFRISHRGARITRP